jgi:hypothetical protein
VRGSFQLVLPSFAYDRAALEAWRDGIRTELWLINDRWESIPQGRLSGRILAWSAGKNSRSARSSRRPRRVTVAHCRPTRHSGCGSRGSGKAPAVPGRYTLRATIRRFETGVAISENDYEFEVR